MFNYLVFVIIPLLLLSVGLGWWASSRPALIEAKVLVGQLMIDSIIISFFLMFFFQQVSILFVLGAAVYAGITSVRLKTLFTKLEYLSGTLSQKSDS